MRTAIDRLCSTTWFVGPSKMGRTQCGEGLVTRQKNLYNYFVSAFMRKPDALRQKALNAREGQERRKHVDRGRHPRELVAKHRALTVESLRQVEDEGDLDGAFVAAVATAPEPVVADEIAGGGGEENERVGRIAPQNFLEQFAQKIVQFGDLGVVVFAEGGIGRSHLGTIIAIVFLHAWRVLIGRRGRCEGRLEGCRRRRIERRGARVVILPAQSMQIRAGERPRESQRPIFLLQNREIGPGPVDRR